MPWGIDDYIYLAGFLDGEGCIGVYSRAKQHVGSRQITPSRSYRPRISIVNTDYSVMKWIHKETGGYLRKKAKIRGHKAIYHLNIVDFRQIEKIIGKCLPWLKVKRKVALTVLKFPHNVKCNQYTKKLTEETFALKEALYLQTLKLNKRGGD